MTSGRPPLRHIVRVRRTEDLTFVRAGLMDEVMLNANQVENSPDSTTTVLRQTALPFSIDPMLTRFQFPNTLRNEKGEAKKNYRRLAATYGSGTGISLLDGPLPQLVKSDDVWRKIASNIIAYQWNRVAEKPTQLELFGSDTSSELRPVRLVAPALAALSAAEDQINCVLADASAQLANAPLAVPVIVPVKRLLEPRGLDQLLASVPSEGAQAYLVWTPNLPESTLLADPTILAQLVRLVATLADRGVPVGHLHGGYVAASLHDLGISALVHHLGWVDGGEPLETGRGGLRSCRSYVPGVRHSVRFENALDLGRSLDANAYPHLYCECAFCAGAFESGQHPLDLLLEEEVIPFKNGQSRRTPTGRAVGANTWHYLLSRRREIERFSADDATVVIEQDIERAATLAGKNETYGLRRLVNEINVA